MDVIKAAQDTKYIMVIGAWRHDHKDEPDDAASYDHLAWMLDGIIDGYVTGDKAHRWLGWAQGVICARQRGATLAAFKNINKNA